MRKLEVKLIGKTDKDLLEILDHVSESIRQDMKHVQDGTGGFEADSGRDVSFGWNLEDTDVADIYGNPIEVQDEK